MCRCSFTIDHLGMCVGGVSPRRVRWSSHRELGHSEFVTGFRVYRKLQAPVMGGFEREVTVSLVMVSSRRLAPAWEPCSFWYSLSSRVSLWPPAEVRSVQLVQLMLALPATTRTS